MRMFASFLFPVVALVMGQPSAMGATCTFMKPGNLLPNSGTGINENRNFAPDMLSPFSGSMPTTKSALFNPGGQKGGDECDRSNFDFNNRDTFCENRAPVRESLNCPTERIHQGIDINGGTSSTCLDLRKAKKAIANGGSPNLARIVPVRAVASGTITNVGSFSVSLRDGPRVYRYLHMQKETLQVKRNQVVKAGDVIGFMFDEFGKDQTKFHLHLEIIVQVDGRGRHVSPYLPFIRAVEREFKVTCAEK